MDTFELSKIKKVIIIGAGHGIGLALAQELSEDSTREVYCTYRNFSKASGLMELAETRSNVKPTDCDPLDENQLQTLKSNLAENGKYQLIINTVGVLHSYNFGPEKSLRSINLENMEYIFKVNTLATPLLAKNLSSLIDKETTGAFVSLSAKLGSISDNELGGWYSYRASKAALNMFMKSISVEFKRMKLPTVVLSIHPGTTRTELTKPFIDNVKHKIWEPSESAKNILNVLEGKTIKDSGLFKNWDDSTLPW